MANRRHEILVLVAAMAMTVGCSDDGGATGGTGNSPDLGSAGGGAIVDWGVGTPTPSKSLSVTTYVVADRSSWATRTVASGITVTATLPDGTLSKKTTGADGKVTFDNLDWTRGTASFTAYKKDHSLVSWTGVTAFQHALEVVLVKLSTAKPVTVSGTARNMAQGYPYLLVTSSAPGSGYYEGIGNTYSFQVPPDRAFSLVGLNSRINSKSTERTIHFEHKAWAMSYSVGLTRDGTVDLFFGKALKPQVFRSTIVLPTSTSSVLYAGSRAMVRVTSLESGLNQALGLARRSSLVDGKSFTIDAEYVRPPGVNNFITQYMLSVGGGMTSTINVIGAPGDGTTVGDFLDPPRLISPTDTAKPVNLWLPAAWSSSEKSAIPQVAIIARNQLLWIVRAPAGTTSIALPDPPADADLPRLLGTDPVDASVGHCADRDAKSYLCARFVSGLTYKVATSGDATGQVLNRKTGQGAGMGDFSVCPEGSPASSCVKTDADGRFKVPAMSYLKDEALVILKPGYVPLRLPLGRKRDGAGFSGWAMNMVEQHAEAALAKVSIKSSGVGHLGIAIMGPAGGLKDARVSLVKHAGDGPIYYGDDEKPDASMSATASHGHLLWWNLPRGEHVVQVTPSDPAATCWPSFAWQAEGKNRFRVKISEGDNSYMRVVCK